MTDCAEPRHCGQQQPTPAEPHTTLCKPGRLNLTTDLRRLPHLDHDLSIIATAARAAGNGTPRLPFDNDVADWRAWFRRNIFHGFAAATTDLGHCPILNPADPYPMCAWLRPQVSRSDKHPAWISYRDWAPYLADALSKVRARGLQLRNPVEVRHVYLPGACLDCGNGRLAAVIYADHQAGRWSYWVCPACQAATPIEAWWDYPKRLAAMRAATDSVTSSFRGTMTS
jgi:hypothetical protein